MTDADPPPLPTPGLALRPRTADDEALLRHIDATVRGPELAASGWPEPQVTSFLRSQFDAQEANLRAAHPHAERSVVMVDGEPVGRLDVDRTDGDIRLIEVALLPEHRGRGVGTVLLGALLAEADAQGLALRLHVEATNPARALYERAGLRVVAEHGLHLAMERLPPTGVPTEPAAAPSDPSADPVEAEANLDLATLTAASLRPLMGDRFSVRPIGIQLELVEVASSGRSAGARESFSLLFHGPLDVRLEQGIHALIHPEHGLLDLFLVPLEPIQDAAPYEAIFT